jgi:hypothetical protein
MVAHSVRRETGRPDWANLFSPIWRLFTFLEMKEVAQIIVQLFFHGNIIILTQMHWAKHWAIFEQPHLVALPGKSSATVSSRGVGGYFARGVGEFFFVEILSNILNGQIEPESDPSKKWARCKIPETISTKNGNSFLSFDNFSV